MTEWWANCMAGAFHRKDKHHKVKTWVTLKNYLDRTPRALWTFSATAEAGVGFPQLDKVLCNLGSFAYTTWNSCCTVNIYKRDECKIITIHGYFDMLWGPAHIFTCSYIKFPKTLKKNIDVKVVCVFARYKRRWGCL